MRVLTTNARSFNVPKHALRALAQNLYDGFTPQGIHVAPYYHRWNHLHATNMMAEAFFIVRFQTRPRRSELE